MTDYAAVLTARYDAEWTLDGDSYEGLTWLSDSPKPTQAELDALWAEVAYERAHAQVEAARRARYALESDGLFFASHRPAGPPNLTEWRAKVAEIQADLPYPTQP